MAEGAKFTRGGDRTDENGAGSRYPQTIGIPEAMKRLEKAGIDVPAYAVAKTPEDAGRAADSIGYPVVLKILSDQVIHKTDVGGVVTGIRSADEARSACERMLLEVPHRVPGAVLNGVLVQAQRPPGLEIIVGGKTDQAFGKVILCGMGGILVELFKDVSIRVLPVEREVVREMVHEMQGYPLVRGFRGSPPLDEEALVTRSSPSPSSSFMTRHSWNSTATRLSSTQVDARSSISVRSQVNQHIPTEKNRRLQWILGSFLHAPLRSSGHPPNPQRSDMSS